MSAEGLGAGPETAADAFEAQLVALASAVGGPLLACDTSGEVASLALVTPTTDAGLGRLTEATLAARALPSEAVMQALVDMVQAAKVPPTALRGLVCGLGPGSFTGLRVGLATLKGLAYGGGIPLYGTSSLAMLAASSGPGHVAVVRDARRDHVYLGVYAVAADGVVACLFADARLPLAEARQAAEAASRAAGGDAHVKLRWAGEGAQLICPEGAALGEQAAPRAAYLLRHAEARLRAGEADDLAALAPAYLFDFL